MFNRLLLHMRFMFNKLLLHMGMKWLGEALFTHACWGLWVVKCVNVLRMKRFLGFCDAIHVLLTICSFLKRDRTAGLHASVSIGN